MRKGAFNRFAVVVAALSIASVVPVGYFYYKNTVPTSYVCNESTYTSGDLTCYPYSSDNYSVNLDTYSFDHLSQIVRPIGYCPEFIINKNYLRKYYKHLVNHSTQESTVAMGVLSKELDGLNAVLKKTSEELKPIEDQYKEDTIAFTTGVCLILPFLTLIALYIIRFLVTFILYGRNRREVQN